MRGNIKTNLKEICCDNVNLIYLTQNKVHWFAPVKVVMDPWVL